MLNLIRKFKSYLIYREAVAKAETLHSETGDRQFVIPSPDGSLIIVDRRNFRLLKRKGYIEKDVRISDLIISSFYYTSDRSGRYPIPEHEIEIRKQKFYLWRKRTRKENRKKKERVS